MSATAQTKVPQSRTNQPPADLATTLSTVGRYELVCRLGHGGMASVYLARIRGSAGFERIVAIKVIHPHLASEPHFVEMFLDEAKIAAKIHHPNVVEILDLGEADGVFFMAMEYVEGDTLAALLRRLRQSQQRLPFAAAVRVILDAASGLAAAHRLNDDAGQPLHLVHRDVSPHNLLVDVHGRVKVVDFGIMKAAGKRSNTITGQLRGKLAYMSPEQARGEVVDQRTDIFALGVVLWEICANERLFSGPTESAVLNKVLRCEVPSLAQKVPDLPAALDLIVNRCLAPNRNDRYPTTEALVEDLKAVGKMLGEENESRDLLHAVMERELGARINYRRQQLRQVDTRERVLDEVDATRAISVEDARGSRASRLSELASKRWPSWLLLPLVGAGLAVLLTRDDPTPVQTPAADAPPAGDIAVMQPPAQAPDERTEAREASPPQRAQEAEPGPQMVQWWFNTVPQGAQIVIDGEVQDEVTPSAVELPLGREPKTVVLRKEGFATRELRLAPIASENHTFVLERMEEPTQAPSDRESKRTRPRPPSPEPEDAPDTRSDARKLADMPDFRSVKDR